MRIKRTPKQTPHGLPSSSPASGAGPSASDEQERFVWEKLAPRLLHPSKLAFIQALLESGEPLPLRELAEAAKIAEDHAEWPLQEDAGGRSAGSRERHATCRWGGGGTFLLLPEAAREGCAPLTAWPRRKKTKEDIASVKGLGRAVRELREKKGWNRVQLADRAGLDFTTIYAVERGAMELTWGNVRRLAKGLEVDLDVLIRCAEALAPGEGGERWRLGSLVAARERESG